MREKRRSLRLSLRRSLGAAALFALWLYRQLLSPALTFIFQPLGFGCRFEPTCSCYATKAIMKHGPWKGLALAILRLARCHPWGGQGHDPVPDHWGMHRS